MSFAQENGGWDGISIYMDSPCKYTCRYTVRKKTVFKLTDNADSRTNEH